MKKLKRERPTIGVLAGWYVYPGYIDSFLELVFQGILSAAQEQECNLMFGCGIGSNYPVSQQKPALPVIASNFEFIPVGPWNCDGLIVATPVEVPGGMDYFQDLIASGYPLVYAGERESGPAVVVDNEYGIQQAMAHLAGHGHRRIVFISGPSTSRFSDVQHRHDAYLASVKELGLEDDPALIIYGDHSEEGSRQAMEQLLKQGIPFSAVMASNDESALGAMTALHSAGKLIPEDISLIGFDDRFEAKAQNPALTTVHHPMFELGYRSVALALKAIYEGVTSEDVIRIRPELVIRESCGCPPGTFNETVKSFRGTDAPKANSTETPPVPLAALKPGQVQPVFQEITTLIHHTISNECQSLHTAEVSYLSWCLVNGLEKSLTGGDPSNFQQTIQQIIEYIAARGDDVYSWQKAVTIIRDHLSEFVTDPAIRLGKAQIEDMLHLGRVTISEISRGQFSRLMVNQSHNVSQLGQMTALFFSAQNETEIFAAANQELPSIGIAHIAVAYYERDGDDPVAWSQLKFPPQSDESRGHFQTRQFPPEGLYASDQPFRLTVLPLVSPNERLGYAAFDVGNLDFCGFIVRQMMASLKSVRLHQEAIEARRVAEEQRKIAEEANRLKSRFLSMVSHELRTPLNLISGLSDMLLNESEAAGPDSLAVKREDLERLYVGARHLDGLIRDVLDLARIDVGKLNLSLELLDINEVLEAAAIIGEKLAKDKDLIWNVDTSKDLPLVLGDRTRLRQVVLNLITNAIKFTFNGGITLSAIYEQGKITVSVIDTGLGIPVDEQEWIFDEFRQSSRTTARGYGGLGLGLAICRRLVEKHGGQISVCSTGEEGKGSTFYFSLPVIETPSPSPTPRNPVEFCQYVLILTKDSDPGIELKRLLLKQGCQTDIVAVVKSPDWLTKLQMDPPDAVILDRDLSAEQGWEILKKIKDNPDTQIIPVLFYAPEAHGSGGTLLELNYLTKPVQAERLAGALGSQGLLELHQTPGFKDDPQKEHVILVVDDDPNILNLHIRILESISKKFHLYQAHDGREALALVQKLLPDLVLLDLMMPDMDGFSVLEAMRENERTRGIPVMVVTGQVLTEEDMSRLNRGIANVLSKGIFSADEISSHFVNILARRRKMDSEQQRTVLKAMAYFHTHYTESISRSDVAAYVGMSERHLTRCFHQEVGLTPITYLNRFRVRQAKYLLDTGCNSITEIAMEVGFSSGGYFTRVFKDEVGISPRTYLQQCYKK